MTQPNEEPIKARMQAIKDRQYNRFYSPDQQLCKGDEVLVWKSDGQVYTYFVQSERGLIEMTLFEVCEILGRMPIPATGGTDGQSERKV